MDKDKKELLEQIEGHKKKHYCEECGKETIHIYNMTGFANCTELDCEGEVKINLKQVVKELMLMNATIE